MPAYPWYACRGLRIRPFVHEGSSRGADRLHFDCFMFGGITVHDIIRTRRSMFASATILELFRSTVNIGTVH